MNIKEKNLYRIWILLYALCVWLGTVKENQGMNRVMLVLAALLFFVPAVLLVIKALREKEYKILKRLRWIAIGSLGLTTLALVGNFLSAVGSDQLGTVLHYVLLVVSAPMMCAQYWALSIFLWACLLMVTLPGVIIPGKKK